MPHTSTRPDEPLDPPAVCCGREFHVRRALEAHARSHGACGEAGCTFAGSRAVLRLHAWEAHGIGSAPKTAPVRGGSTLHDELCAGRAGNEFKIVDELPAEAVPLEMRFPGADIVWIHDAAEAGALGPAEDGADDEWSREADGHSSAVLPWPDGCRILMIVGATGSGKTRLLRSLAGCAASLRSRPRWPSGRSILDGLGADGAARSGAVGADGRWRTAVRRTAVRPRCGGAANGGAATATAVRRRRCGAKLYSRGHRSHRSRSSSVHFTVLRSSLLVLRSGRVRVWAPDGKRKSSPYATPAKPVTRNGYGFDCYDHARFITTNRHLAAGARTDLHASTQIADDCGAHQSSPVRAAGPRG
jgi:hypothetical protein